MRQLVRFSFLFSLHFGSVAAFGGNRCGQPGTTIDLMPCRYEKGCGDHVCDPNIKVYRLYGEIDHWTPNMPFAEDAQSKSRKAAHHGCTEKKPCPQHKPCGVPICPCRDLKIGFHWTDESEKSSRIVLIPSRFSTGADTEMKHWARFIKTDLRRVRVEGCFASPDLFIVDSVDPDRSR